jgi:hypothetical protein
VAHEFLGPELQRRIITVPGGQVDQYGSETTARQLQLWKALVRDGPGKQPRNLFELADHGADLCLLMRRQGRLLGHL